jgi:phosphohistidine phosphatase
MELYLFRHGIAEEASAGHPDSSRQLTEEGRKKTAAVAKMARLAGAEPSLILSSPYDRAVQTARVAADELGYKGEILQTRTLVPHGAPEPVWSDVRDHSEEQSILLAGHEPLLSCLTAWLLGAPALQVEVKKSAMIRIDFDSLRATPRGVLRWMITPSLTGK